MANNKIQFVGTVKVPRDKEKFVRVYDDPNGKYSIHTISFMVQDKDGSGEWAELGGFAPTSDIKTIANKEMKFKKITIKKEDRLTQKAIDSVADFKKVKIDLGEGRKEFISEYDAVHYLKEKLPAIVESKKRIKLMGEYEMSSKNGKVYRKFIPENIYLAKESDEEGLKGKFVLYTTEDSFDDTRFDDEKKIDVFGYLKSYDRSYKKDMFFPTNFVMDFRKVNLDNEKNQKRFKYLVKTIKTPAGKVNSMMWMVNIFSGSEEVQFDESMLTYEQQEQIELGMSTLEDMKPDGGFSSESKTELQLIKPIAKYSFADGVVDAGFTPQEFEELVVREHKVDKVQDKALTDPTEDSDVFDDDDGDDWLG